MAKVYRFSYFSGFQTIKAYLRINYQHTHTALTHTHTLLLDATENERKTITEIMFDNNKIRKWIKWSLRQMLIKIQFRCTKRHLLLKCFFNAMILEKNFSERKETESSFDSLWSFKAFNNCTYIHYWVLHSLAKLSLVVEQYMNYMCHHIKQI